MQHPKNARCRGSWNSAWATPVSLHLLKVVCRSLLLLSWHNGGVTRLIHDRDRDFCVEIFPLHLIPQSRWHLSINSNNNNNNNKNKNKNNNESTTSKQRDSVYVLLLLDSSLHWNAIFQNRGKFKCLVFLHFVPWAYNALLSLFALKTKYTFAL